MNTYPISKKILRISSRTLRIGWRAPPDVGIPSASKLYFLKEEVFQEPLRVREKYKPHVIIRTSNPRCEHINGQVSLWFFDRSAEVGTLMHSEPLTLSLRIVRLNYMTLEGMSNLCKISLRFRSSASACSPVASVPDDSTSHSSILVVSVISGTC